MPGRESPVGRKREGGTLAVTLARPNVRNAIDEPMLAGLETACDEACADPPAGVVVFQGAGGFFSAGGDLRERERLLSERNRAEMIARSRREGLLLDRIARLPSLTVAIVEGGAFGLALGIVAAVDLVLATRSAVFAAPEVIIGAVPAQIAPFIVARLGAGEARRLLLTGATIRAEEAFGLGLVHEIFDDEAGLMRAAARAESLAERKKGIAATKRLLALAKEHGAGYAGAAAEIYADVMLG